MERLGGLDAAFLYFETPTMHMHVCGLLVLDTSDLSPELVYQRVRTLMVERLPRMGPMRRKLAVAPFNLGRPYWIDDADFDIDYHLRRIALPSPGDDRALAEVAGDLAGRPLDRSRPLWEMWVIEGLAKGYSAVFAKMHHSTIDGISGANMMVHLFDLEPVVPKGADEEIDDFVGERRPRDFELFARGALQTMVRPLGMARLMPTTALRLGTTLWNVGRRRSSGASAAVPFRAPRTSFNASITAHRSVAFTQVPLSEIKTVKEAFSVKVNDVVTAVVSGALRQYLAARSELPGRSLIAAVPVSVHDQAVASEGATKVSVMFSNLATDVEDPAERLRLIAGANADAKDLHKMVGASTLMQWAEHAAPNTFSLAARLYSRMHIAERHPVLHNFILSNVPGPPVPLYMAGSRLVALYPLGPVMDGAGLNITVLSNEDQIGFGFIACRELVPDPWQIADAVPEALSTLVKEATSG